MAFKVGERVRINFAEGVQWVKKIGQNAYTASDVQGYIGTITQAMSSSGQAEYKVLLPGVGEPRFWERDLAAVVELPVEYESASVVDQHADDVIEDEFDGPSEQIQ